MTRTLETAIERWPIAGGFAIARGSKTEAIVVVVTVREGRLAGRGEAVPYARYGETVDGVVAAIGAIGPAIVAGMERAALQDALPPGAARNAVDCALWDLEAKRTGRAIAGIAGLPPPRSLVTALT